MDLLSIWIMLKLIAAAAAFIVFILGVIILYKRYH